MADGNVTVTDVNSGEVVFRGEYHVPANGQTVVASIPERDGQGIFKISYTGMDGSPQENHYLYGKAPYDLNEYRRLLKKTRMFNVK